MIGAGAAGLSITNVAARLGLRVTLIERARMGGDCLNAGCVPSKALLAAGHAAQAARVAVLSGAAFPRAPPQGGRGRECGIARDGHTRDLASTRGQDVERDSAPRAQGVDRPLERGCLVLRPSGDHRGGHQLGARH